MKMVGRRGSLVRQASIATEMVGRRWLTEAAVGGRPDWGLPSGVPVAKNHRSTVETLVEQAALETAEGNSQTFQWLPIHLRERSDWAVEFPFGREVHYLEVEPRRGRLDSSSPRFAPAGWGHPATQWPCLPAFPKGER